MKPPANSLRIGRATDSSGNVINSSLIQIPAPMTPSVVTNQQLQNTSTYSSLRSIVDVTNAIQNMMNLGTIATSGTDGRPLTFTAGGFGNKLIRVAPAGSNTGATNTWVAGGGETTIPHGLGKIPIGYWVVRKSRDCDIYDGDSTWTAQNIYLHTTHSDADCILSIF